MHQEMDEVERLQRELEAMPEWDRIWSVREFQSTVSIFRTNAAEVLKFLKESERKDTDHGPFETASFAALQQELARLVHNFVAAAFTLVDHARVFLSERYQATPLYADYNAEVDKRFRKGGLHQFVRGLRNFIVHQRFPPVTSLRTWAEAEGQPVRHMHFWQKVDLLTSKDWNTAAKRYLESAPAQIHISYIVADYEKLVGSFYDWVFARLQAHHDHDERAVAAKQRQIDELVERAAAS